MTTGHQTVRFDALTYEEVARRAAGGSLAIVPTGCTEQQGPHLPVGFDTRFADALCVAAAERARAAHGVDCLVLPALPFGPTPEHRAYGAGFIDLPSELHAAVVAATLDSLAAQGFETVIVWRGCGGHDLRCLEKRDDLRVVLPDPPFHAVWCRLGDPSVPGGHADSFTTSVALHLWPDEVRRDRIPDERIVIDWDAVPLDFARWSTSGVIGDARHASAPLGQRLWDACVEEVARMVAAAADHPTAE
jgi:creatinine amidohydrolase